MNIRAISKIEVPLTFSEIGKRKNNEDSIYPKGQINSDARLFLVCDGMGGTEGGEIASNLTCEIISQYFNKYVTPYLSVSIIEQHIYKAVEKVYNRLEKLVIEKPNLDKMGTTLTLLYIHNDGITIAHIGDSRVYHIQESSCWHTEDHSLVYELYKIGAIEKSELATHSNKNIITKVISCKYERDKPEIKHIKNISNGDYLLLMTDGVLEGIDEPTLISIVRDRKQVNEYKINTIKDYCKNNSTDNYSLIFIKTCN